jgi:heat shock protein HslJ
MWTLADAGAEAGTVVGLTPGELTIYQECGGLMAAWRADAQGLFVGSLAASTDACDPETRVGWLDKAAAYRLDGRNVVLLDVDGRTVARLVASGEPPRPDRESFEVTEQVRNSFGPAASLPARLRVAGHKELLGRWVPIGEKWGTPKPPHLELRADGRWLGWDGCNGSGGGWVLGSAGTVLATTGPSTLIGCDGAPVNAWLSSARLAGFDGATLVLLDQDAKELGRLRRDGGPGTTPPLGTEDA